MMFTQWKIISSVIPPTALYTESAFTCSQKKKTTRSTDAHVLAITLSSKDMVFDCDTDGAQHSKTLSLQNL